jgi:hypothetical protein
MLKAAKQRSGNTDDLQKYCPQDPKTKTVITPEYVTKMRDWVKSHPQASTNDGVAAFAGFINEARAHGAKVSDHLTDRALDIPIPNTEADKQKVRNIIKQYGGVLKEEPAAAGGQHWHISFPEEVPHVRLP